MTLSINSAMVMLNIQVLSQVITCGKSTHQQDTKYVTINFSKSQMCSR